MKNRTQNTEHRAQNTEGKDFLKAIISYFKKRKDIACVYLFGSQVKGAGWKKKPDIDIAILFKKNGSLSRIYADISQMLKRDDIDIVNLGKAPPILSHEILKNGKCIFSKINREDYEVKTHLFYYDTKPLRDFLNKVMIERLKKDRFGYGKNSRDFKES